MSVSVRELTGERVFSICTGRHDYAELLLVCSQLVAAIDDGDGFGTVTSLAFDGDPDGPVVTLVISDPSEEQVQEMLRRALTFAAKVDIEDRS